MSQQEPITGSQPGIAAVCQAEETWECLAGADR